MKNLFPYLFFLIIVAIFFRSVFGGYLPIPADTIVGLYNPYRDFYSKMYSRGVPYKNFLITDPVRQQYPWRNLAVSLEKDFQLPLWNPYNFSGIPLLANYQSAPLYPLNIFFFLLSFNNAWTLLVILQPFLAGLFLYFYLRNMRLHVIPSLLGGITFAFSGFGIAWMEWNSVLQVALWLPLVLLAKEKLLKNISFFWFFILFVAEVSMILAGHIQVYVYALLVSNLYLFCRIYQINNKVKDGLHKIVSQYVPFLLFGVFLCLFTAIQWIPTLQFILYSARSVDQSNWQQIGWFIPWQNAVQFIIPDFFGNPATLNYWGVWNYGEFIGYVGILPLIFAFFALCYRRDKKTLFFGTLFIMSLIFSFPTFLAKIPYILHIPFLSTTQPTRLLFLTDFSLAILAACGFDYFLKVRAKIMPIIVGVGVVFGVICFSLFVLGRKLPISVTDLSVSKHNVVFPIIIYIMCAILLIFYHISKNTRMRSVTVFALLLLSMIDLMRFGMKFESFSQFSYLYPDTKSLSYIQQHIGNYRIMETDAQILPPNFSSMYHIQDVSGYDPLYLLSYGEFIASSERSRPDISGPFGFNRIITPRNYNSSFIDLLGVKYVLSLSDITSSKLRNVYQEGQTRVYENIHVLPRAFFVQSIEWQNNKQQVMNALFTHQDFLHHGVIEKTNQSSMVQRATFTTGNATIVSYTPENVVITTQNVGEGYLILTDAWYPTWRVMVDGRDQSHIDKTDGAFRGVVIPAGNHTVVFYDTLFNF